jgi:hypothetical protein
MAERESRKHKRRLTIMFQAVVQELQILGASAPDALRIANEIEFAQRNPTDTAKKIARQAWQEEQESLANQGQYIIP